MGTTWKQAFHALQCPWPLAPIHTCSWESNKTIIAISEVIILWYSLVQWSPLSQHSPEVSKCVIYIRSVKDTPSFIEMLILLVPFHLRFCALFNEFSTEPSPPPPLAPPPCYRQSLPCWTTSPTISGLWETTCWQRSCVGKYHNCLKMGAGFSKWKCVYFEPDWSSCVRLHSGMHPLFMSAVAIEATWGGWCMIPVPWHKLTCTMVSNSDQSDCLKSG